MQQVLFFWTSSNLNACRGQVALYHLYANLYLYLHISIYAFVCLFTFVFVSTFVFLYNLIPLLIAVFFQTIKGRAAKKYLCYLHTLLHQMFDCFCICICILLKVSFFPTFYTSRGCSVFDMPIFQGERSRCIICSHDDYQGTFWNFFLDFLKFGYYFTYCLRLSRKEEGTHCIMYNIIQDYFVIFLF